MTPLAEAQQDGRRKAALIRQEKKRTAWVFNPRFPAWAYLGELGIPEGGVSHKIEKIHIHDPIPDERG